MILHYLNENFEEKNPRQVCWLWLNGAKSTASQIQSELFFNSWDWPWLLFASNNWNEDGGQLIQDVWHEDVVRINFTGPTRSGIVRSEISQTVKMKLHGFFIAKKNQATVRILFMNLNMN